VPVGSRALRDDPATYFAAAVELPAAGCVVEAQEGRPEVTASLAIDRRALTSLGAEMGPSPVREAASGFGVAPVTCEFLDTWDLLLALLDMPGDIPFL